MILSGPQHEALAQIEKIDNFENGRWFTQMELNRVTLHTMRALEEKGFLRHKWFDEMKIMYYQYVKKDVE